jgi:hypothetical protein
MGLCTQTDIIQLIVTHFRYVEIKVDAETAVCKA